MRFSLKELLIFITGIQLFLAVIGYNYHATTHCSPYPDAEVQVKDFMNALELYKARRRGGRYPSTSEGLEALTKGIGNSNKPIIYAIPKDPWGNDYVYKRIGNRYEIICYGADGEPGGEGNDADITASDIRKGRY